MLDKRGEIPAIKTYAFRNMVYLSKKYYSFRLIHQTSDTTFTKVFRKNHANFFKKNCDSENWDITLLSLQGVSRVQCPRCLRRRSTAARLLRSWVRIPPWGKWMSVCWECCVLSGRGLCDEQITRPEESYRLGCVVVCDLETSWMRRPWPTGGLLRQKQTNKQTNKQSNRGV